MLLGTAAKPAPPRFCLMRGQSVRGASRVLHACPWVACNGGRTTCALATYPLILRSRTVQPALLMSAASSAPQPHGAAPPPRSDENHAPNPPPPRLRHPPHWGGVPRSSIKHAKHSRPDKPALLTAAHAVRRCTKQRPSRFHVRRANTTTVGTSAALARSE